MIVRILSCGTHWWGQHSGPLDDPFRFRRRSAYFNSTSLMSGRRRHDCFLYPGRIRFNRTSGFDPESVDRISGKTYEVSGPTLHGGELHLLFAFPAISRTPEAYLVTIRSETHGAIPFSGRAWRAPGAQPIAVSSLGDRYEAMLLLRPRQWVETDRGRWVVNADGRKLILEEGVQTHAL